MPIVRVLTKVKKSKERQIFWNRVDLGNRVWYGVKHPLHLSGSFTDVSIGYFYEVDILD